MQHTEFDPPSTGVAAAPTPVAPPPTDAATGPTVPRAPSAVRDRMLDVVRAIAVVRVVLWHTWSWWWLTWVPAMPAMFFANGALLVDSVERRGWWDTVRQRLRRLMPPFWAYAAASVVTMVALGWRPDPVELVRWVVPIADPVGSASTPGLWIPLWYVRAYLWFVLASGLLAAVARRFRAASVVCATAVALGAWLAQRAGVPIPAELADALTYSVFVLAGMAYRMRGAPSRAVSVALTVAAAAGALLWWYRFGPADGIVNRSLALTALVGLAGVGLALTFREQLSSVGGPAGRVVDVIGRRALTIYLWQGFGLVAAQRLVDLRMSPGPVRAVASLAVVVVVVVGAVVLFGPLEDWSARRRSERRAGSRGRIVTLAAPGVVVLLVALLLPLPEGSSDAVAAPLSGKAVVTRAQDIQRQLGKPSNTSTTTIPPTADRPAAIAAVLRGWLDRHQQMVQTIDVGSINGALIASDGEMFRVSWIAGGDVVVTSETLDEAPTEEPIPWWSMTKAATAMWFVRSVEAGAVSLDDRLSRWVPEVPNAGRITLEQLARHMSGIPKELDESFLDAAPDRAIDAYRENPRLAFPPGQGFEYSRVGYFLLALALERATGTPWRTAIEALAAEAGVALSFDEDVTPLDRVTDPDGHGYRGGLWSSGGILSTLSHGARFVRWAFTEGLGPDARATMATFSSDPDHWFYGIGLMPLCPPCEVDGDRLVASRFGLDAAPGFFVVDPEARTALMLAPGAWFDDDGPRPEFYELQSQLLDVLV